MILMMHYGVLSIAGPIIYVAIAVLMICLIRRGFDRRVGYAFLVWSCAELVNRLVYFYSFWTNVVYGSVVLSPIAQAIEIVATWVSVAGLLAGWIILLKASAGWGERGKA